MQLNPLKFFLVDCSYFAGTESVYGSIASRDGSYPYKEELLNAQWMPFVYNGIGHELSLVR